MEETISSGPIYDHVLPHAPKISGAPALLLRAIAAAEKRTIRSMMPLSKQRRESAEWVPASSLSVLNNVARLTLAGEILLRFSCTDGTVSTNLTTALQQGLQIMLLM
jgi:hypothetical protein